MLDLPDYATARAGAAAAEHALRGQMLTVQDDSRFTDFYLTARSDAAIGRASEAGALRASATGTVLAGDHPRPTDYYTDVKVEAHERACLLLLGPATVMARFLHAMTVLAATDEGREDLTRRIRDNDPLMWAGPAVLMAGRFAQACQRISERVQTGEAPGRLGDSVLDAVIDRAGAWLVATEQPVPAPGSVDDHLVKLLDLALRRNADYWIDQATTTAAGQRRHVHDLTDAIEDLNALEAAGAAGESLQRAQAVVEQRRHLALRTTVTLLNAAYRLTRATVVTGAAA